MSDTTPASKVCLARQPILDCQSSIIAYEMLFRQINASAANVIDGTAATADVIMNLFNNMGLSSVIGNKKAFINFNDTFLETDIINILPKDRVVLEILETVEITEQLFAHLKALTEAGFTLAIDDFIDNDSTHQLFHLAKIMKIDISDYSTEQLQRYAKLGQQHKLTLLAERVETQDDFTMCKEMGFELYQGYFFAKPEYIEQSTIPSSKLAIISILNDITADKPIEDIERKISHNVSVSYKLLRYINSAGLRRDMEVDSIRSVIQLLGIKPLYRWLSLFLFTNDNNNDANLFVTALTRAFFLEYIAQQTDKKLANDLFILGIFSYLDTLLKMPFSEALKDISIPENIKMALLEQSGPYNNYYQLALLVDSNDFTQLAAMMKKLKLSDSQVTDAHLYAMQMATSLL